MAPMRLSPSPLVKACASQLLGSGPVFKNIGALENVSFGALQ